MTEELQAYEMPIARHSAENKVDGKPGENCSDRISNIYHDAFSSVGNRKTVVGNEYDILPEKSHEPPPNVQQKSEPDYYPPRPKRPNQPAPPIPNQAVPPLPSQAAPPTPKLTAPPPLRQLVPEKTARNTVGKQTNTTPTQNTSSDIRCTMYETLPEKSNEINISENDKPSTPLPVKSTKKLMKRKTNEYIIQSPGGTAALEQDAGKEKNTPAKQEPTDLERRQEDKDPVITMSILKRLLSFCICFFVLGVIVGVALTLAVMLTKFHFEDQIVVVQKESTGKNDCGDSGCDSTTTSPGTSPMTTSRTRTRTSPGTSLGTSPSTTSSPVISTGTGSTSPPDTTIGYSSGTKNVTDINNGTVSGSG